MNIRKHLLAATAFTAAVTAAGAAAAQAPPRRAPGNEVDSVVVTAQRREESLQEVPVSVTAIGKELIEQVHPQNLSDFSRVAGLTISAILIQVGPLCAFACHSFFASGRSPSEPFSSVAASAHE